MRFGSRAVFASLCLGLALLLSVDARAELTTVDLVPGSGDGNLVRDSESKLDWLRVTLTVDQTYDQVRTGQYYAQGFRHATRAEVETLFMHAGIPNDGFDISVTHSTEALALVGLLGSTWTPLNGMNTMGFVGTDFAGNDVTTTNYPIGTQFSALLGKVNYINLTDVGYGLIGEAHFTGGHPFSDQADETYGSFLVRSSPDEGIASTAEALSAFAKCRTAGKSKNPKCKGQARGQW
jgi:hypothetical protein